MYVPYVKPVIQIRYLLVVIQLQQHNYAETDCPDDRLEVISLSVDASSLSIPLSSTFKWSV